MAAPDPIRSSASRRRSRSARRPEQADARDRQPVRDDRLRPAEEPRRVRAARELRGRRDRHRARDHATELCRAGRPEGYDVVVAFGGDGTVNEAANGLVGSDTPLTLPSRAAARTSTAGCSGSRPTSSTRPSTCCGWPTTGARAGSTSAASASATSLFSAGVGLDASVVERVDAHPRLKARLGEWYYTWPRSAVQPPLPVPPAAARGRARRASASPASPRSSRTRRRTRTSATARSRWARARRSTAATWPASSSARQPDRHADGRLAGALERAGSPATARSTRSRGGALARPLARRAPAAASGRRRLHRRGRRGRVRRRRAASRSSPDGRAVALAMPPSRLLRWPPAWCAAGRCSRRAAASSAPPARRRAGLRDLPARQPVEPAVDRLPVARNSSR